MNTSERQRMEREVVERERESVKGMKEKHISEREGRGRERKKGRERGSLTGREG